MCQLEVEAKFYPPSRSCSDAEPPFDPVLERELAQYQEDLATVDIHSEAFSCLPPHVQHELLLERQQIEKYSHHDPHSLPQVTVGT